MIKRVQEILISCGWTTSRIIDTSKYMRWYQSEGYKPPFTILEFLKEFGGLKMQIPRKNSHNKSDNISDIVILCDPISNGFEAEFNEDYNTFFEVDMYPVATSTTAPLDFFMDSTGAFYAMYGSIGAKWGNSFEEFILNIMDGNVSDLEKIC